MSELLDREALEEVLRQLGARLVALGVSAELYVVGGAAIALAYDSRRLTRDVDAIAVPADVVFQEARAMAVERRWLSSDWLNSRVAPMVPRLIDSDAVEALSAPGISVNVASPRHLLAMKMRAARGERDIDDIVVLARELSLQDVAEVLAVADEVWGDGMVRPDAAFLVGEALRARGFG